MRTYKEPEDKIKEIKEKLIIEIEDNVSCFELLKYLSNTTLRKILKELS